MKCTHCNPAIHFKDDEALMKHVEKAHPVGGLGQQSVKDEDELEYVCKVCEPSVRLNDRKSFKKHIKDAHGQTWRMDENE